MYARDFFVVMFFGFHNPLSGNFLANLNPLFIRVVGYPFWWTVVCSSLRKFF